MAVRFQEKGNFVSAWMVAIVPCMLIAIVATKLILRWGRVWFEARDLGYFQVVLSVGPFCFLVGLPLVHTAMYRYVSLDAHWRDGIFPRVLHSSGVFGVVVGVAFASVGFVLPWFGYQLGLLSFASAMSGLALGFLALKLLLLRP